MTAQGLCEAAGSILRAGVKVQQALAKVAVLYGCGNLSAGAVLSKCAADLRQNGGDNDWSRIVSMVIMVTPLPALADHILVWTGIRKTLRSSDLSPAKTGDPIAPRSPRTISSM
jgi:hypothetical protein